MKFMNMFDKVIRDLREANGGNDDELIRALLDRKAALGPDASEEEIMAAVKEVMTEQFQGGTGSAQSRGSAKQESNADFLSPEDQVYMAEAVAAVKAFLEENEWRYSTRVPRADVTLFEMGFTVKKCSLRVKIHVEANPHVCRIDAILPITADATYEYPLCAAMAKENYAKRFGSLKYDERDGEVSFEYSYPIGHGVYQDDLDRVFHAVVSSAVNAFDMMRKCCVGKFKSREVNEILQKVNALVSDLSDE